MKLAPPPRALDFQVVVDRFVSGVRALYCLTPGMAYELKSVRNGR